MKPHELSLSEYDDYSAECPKCSKSITVHYDYSMNQEESITYYQCDNCHENRWWYN